MAGLDPKPSVKRYLWENQGHLNMNSVVDNAKELLLILWSVIMPY